MLQTEEASNCRTAKEYAVFELLSLILNRSLRSPSYLGRHLISLMLLKDGISCFQSDVHCAALRRRSVRLAALALLWGTRARLLQLLRVSAVCHYCWAPSRPGRCSLRRPPPRRTFSRRGAAVGHTRGTRSFCRVEPYTPEGIVV